MITALNDLSVLQNHDGVGVPHCGKTVGEHESGCLLYTSCSTELLSITASKLFPPYVPPDREFFVTGCVGHGRQRFSTQLFLF